MTREKAEALVDAIVSMRESATDKQASNSVALYPTLKGKGALVKGGARINWNGTIKRASVDLWDTDINTPDAAPNLWEDINLDGGYRVIPETITSTLAFAKNECGWWDGVLYKSLKDGNVHTPEQAPEVWEVVST